jgi:hypothetical protein
MPEARLHIMKNATILRILEGLGQGFVQEGRSLAKAEKSFMSLYVCLYHVFSCNKPQNESSDGYFAGLSLLVITASVRGTHKTNRTRQTRRCGDQSKRKK